MDASLIVNVVLTLAVLALVGYVASMALRVSREIKRQDAVVAALNERVNDGQAVDYDAPRPLGAGPHSHVWGPTPFHQDGFSKSFACQVPRCGRVSTQSLR